METRQLYNLVKQGMFENAAEANIPLCSLCRDLSGIPHLHGSDFDVCERMLFYKFYNQINKINSSVPDNIVFLREGFFHEETILNGLCTVATENQFIVEQNKEFILDSGIPNFLISIHPDAIIRTQTDNFIIECKSLAQGSIDNQKVSIQKMPTNYYGQMQAYLHYLKMSYGFFLVKSRNNSELSYPVKVEYNEEYCFNRINSISEIIQQAKLTNELPDRRYQYQTIECRFCAFTKQCWNGD